MRSCRWLCASPPCKQFLVGFHATRPTPHGAPRSVQVTPAWSARTRHTPSRHRRGARVYGHTTATVRDMNTPPPPPAPRSLEYSGSFLCSSVSKMSAPLPLVLLEHGRSPCSSCFRMNESRPHSYHAGTEHVGFSPTRLTSLGPSAELREVLSESHER